MEEATTEPNADFPRKAARFSMWAPLIAVGFSTIFTAISRVLPEAKLMSGVLTLLLIATGFIAAIYGLVATRKHGRKGIFGYAIAGLMLNGGLIFLMAFSIPVMLRSMEYAKRQAALSVEQLEAMPPENPDFNVIVDEQLKFRFEVPADFEPDREQVGVGATKYAFSRLNAFGGKDMITITSLGGEIGRETLSQADLAKMKSMVPAGAEINRYVSRWDNKPLEGFHQRIPVENVLLSVYSAQVPIKGEAIQVNVSGPTSEEAVLEQRIKAILKSLKGKTNWQ